MSEKEKERMRDRERWGVIEVKRMEGRREI